MLDHFIAIDFETANERKWSACQIGITKVIDNIVIYTDSYLINPKCGFAPYQQKIHGITAEKVKDAPTFEELWDLIHPFFEEESNIIAHNSDFDADVLYSCFERYNIKPPELNIFCTMKITKALFKFESYSLKNLLYNLNIEHLGDYHDAADDSLNCALMMIHLNKIFPNIIDKYIYPDTEINIDNEKEPQNTAGVFKYYNAIKPSDFICSVPAEEIDILNPLYNKSIVVTGDFAFCTVQELFQKIVDKGGIIRTSVSKKTDYLFVGTPDLSVVKDKENGKSSKHLKAEEINNCATCENDMVIILYENEFIDLLDYNEKTI